MQALQLGRKLAPGEPVDFRPRPMVLRVLQRFQIKEQILSHDRSNTGKLIKPTE